MRSEIDRLDEQLLLLLSKRMEVARRIGEAKARGEAPLRDEARETVVRSRWLESAARLGVPASLAEGLLSLVLRESIRSQLRPPRESITVVGSGRMASALLSTLGGSAVSTDFLGEPRLKPCDAFSSSDYIIIATRPSILGNAAFRGSLECASGKVVSDVFSAKGSAFKELESLSQSLGFKYVSLHPLFSGAVDPWEEVMVVVPSATSGDALGMVVRLWEGLGFRVVTSDADYHDRAMAVAQVIHHLYLAALMRALERASRELGVDYSRFVTHSLKSTLAVAERVMRQPEVVREIQSTNRYAAMARRLGVEALREAAEELGGVS